VAEPERQPVGDAGGVGQRRLASICDKNDMTRKKRAKNEQEEIKLRTICRDRKCTSNISCTHTLESPAARSSTLLQHCWGRQQHCDGGDEFDGGRRGGRRG
jgi:hypothetical protein